MSGHQFSRNQSLWGGEGGKSLNTTEVQFLHEVGTVFLNGLHIHEGKNKRPIEFLV